MSLWNSDKAFRNDYEKRILPSLDMRQLSRDGRMRNPDEKPLLEEPKPADTVAPAKTVPKQPKEEPKPAPQETLPAQVVQKEAKNKGRDSKSKPEKDSAETDEYEFANPHKETPAKEPEINPAKLKEIKREEEIAKAKQALERKKKLAEKAAAKAALRAQKEAEKKLKVIVNAILLLLALMYVFQLNDLRIYLNILLVLGTREESSKEERFGGWNCSQS